MRLLEECTRLTSLHEMRGPKSLLNDGQGKANFPGLTFVARKCHHPVFWLSGHMAPCRIHLSTSGERSWRRTWSPPTYHAMFRPYPKRVSRAVPSKERSRQVSRNQSYRIQLSINQCPPSFCSTKATFHKAGSSWTGWPKPQGLA